jgi:predicted dehydrogenase
LKSNNFSIDLPMTKSRSASSVTRNSRRSFLKQSALLTATAVTPAVLKPTVYGQAPSVNVVGANDRLVVGVIGTGKQGVEHLRLLKKQAATANLRIGAVCDVYQKHLEAARGFADVTDREAFRDHRKLLEQKDLDAVFIATVDNWHGPCSLNALDAGKHVYCEKPMTRYAAEGWAVYDQVKRTGKVYQCGSQYCADPVVHQAAKWIKEGKLGPLVWAQGSYCRNNPKNDEWEFPVDADASPANLDWDRWQGNARKVPWSPEAAHRYFCWHKYYDYNSGILGNLLSHRFYALMLATGNPEFPSRVVCTGTRKVSTNRDISDTTHVLAEFPSGLTFVIAGTTVNEVGLPDVIRGRQATIYLASGANQANLQPEKNFVEELDAEEFRDPAEHGRVQNLHANFFDCIRSGGKLYCNVDVVVRANTVLALAEMSERLGVVCFYEEKTRTIRNGEGKVIPAMSYDTVVPKLS